MIDRDHVPVGARWARRLDRAVGRGINRLAAVGRDVEAAVECIFARDRIASPAERVGEPPLGRPDGRCRGRQRLPPLDPRLHAPEPSLEAVQQSRSTPKVSSGTLKPGTNTGGTLWAAAGGGPPAARDFDDGRQPFDGALDLGVDRGALTELRDGRLQRLQLRGELPGRGAVAAVLDLQHARPPSAAARSPRARSSAGPARRAPGARTAPAPHR